MSLDVALVQLAAAGHDLERNAEIGERACRRAAAMGAQIAVFPEMWSVGYMPAIRLDPSWGDVYRSPGLWDDGCDPPLPPFADVWAGLAISCTSGFVERFQALAVELDLAIVLTYLEEWPGLPRNTATVIDRHGRLVLTYAKVHTCAFDIKEAALTPGDSFPVVDLETSSGEVRVGVMICYDREFPESARELMLGGAEVILIPSASSIDSHRLSQVRVRSEENMVGVAMANAPGPGRGHSVAYDGIAYAGGEGRDSLIVEAGEQEVVAIARFDLDAIRDYRRRETWGNAFRRPAAYQRLNRRDVDDPFVRVDHGGHRGVTWR